MERKINMHKGHLVVSMMEKVDKGVQLSTSDLHLLQNLLEDFKSSPNTRQIAEDYSERVTAKMSRHYF
ncbi:MAG: hypothetical protein WC511_02375 [Candidatus Pacearchaeota archaeon]